MTAMRRAGVTVVWSEPTPEELTEGSEHALVRCVT